MAIIKDFLLIDVLVYDGSGAEPYLASIRIVPPKIDKIYDHRSLPESEQRELESGCYVIQCQGQLACCPGFIDMHAHSDLSLLHTPHHLAKITQGVTTEVLGQDGIGYAPVNDECLALIRQQIAGWNGNPADSQFWSWRSVKEYMGTLEQRGIATNAAYLVPQGNLRMLVLGYDPRPATTIEIEAMKQLLARSIEEGAVGMSSGLTYVPGMYASDSELAQLLAVVKQMDGYYCPHHRSYGKGAVQAYKEMLDLAESTGVRLHLTHAILNFDENRGKAPELLQMLRKYRERGVEVSLDTYPYLPGSTTLAAQLPSWAAAGGPAQCLARLRNPVELEKIRHDVEVVGTDGCHGCTVDWNTIEISGTSNKGLSHIVGLTITQIRDRRLLPHALTGFDVMIAILIMDELSTTILQHVGHEINVRAMIQDDFHCGGSDGILTSIKPHPRGHGCFTRFLGHYARDLPLGLNRDIYVNSSETDTYTQVEPVRVFPGGMAEAIAHLTSRPARVLRLTDRGVIAEHCFADLVVFDPELVRDTATFAEPELYSRGIVYVFVNGELMMQLGTPTLKTKGGMVLRRKA